MTLFGNGEMEDLLFVRNFNMTLKASGTLQSGANIQYLCMIFFGGALCKCDMLSSDSESSTPLTLEAIILGLGMYFFPVYVMSKQNRAMRRVMRKPLGLKVRRNAAHSNEFIK